MGPPIFAGNPGTTTIGLVAFWLTFYAWLLSELWLGWRKRPPANALARDRGSQWAVIAGVWLSVSLGIALASIFRSTAFGGGRWLFVVAGIVLMVAGMALRWYSIAVLGRAFTVTVAIEAGQRVIERGPYRLVRHPSYTGSLVTILGVLVACANPLALLGLVPGLIGYAYRIRVEEAVLSDTLGEAYRSYMRRTTRLIPFLL